MTAALSPLAAKIEEVCLNAWPALQEMHFDGWLLRFANGMTRRTNSVNVVREGVLTLAEKVSYCEEVYRRNGLATIFMILPVRDRTLDVFLDARGYVAVDETSTLYADFQLHPISAVTDHVVELLPDRPSAEWLAARAAFRGLSKTDGANLEKILRALAIPTVFASVRDDEGRIVSIAKGAVHTGVVCLNLVATDPHCFRRGYSRACVTAILKWARDEMGAQGACLQAVSNNTPAITLYRDLGFTEELYRYRYRVRPVHTV